MKKLSFKIFFIFLLTNLVSLDLEANFIHLYFLWTINKQDVNKCIIITVLYFLHFFLSFLYNKVYCFTTILRQNICALFYRGKVLKAIRLNQVITSFAVQKNYIEILLSVNFVSVCGPNVLIILVIIDLNSFITAVSKEI